MNTAAFASLYELTPELARYGGEPAQMPSASHGKCGFLDLRFVRDPESGRSLLRDMERRVPFLVQKALYWDEMMPELPCVMVITTSGCLLQGDRMEMRVRVEEGACAHVTTQSATKIHMMDANHASQVQYLEVEEDGYLEYMPDPVIPHRTSRFASDTQLVVAESGTALYGEILQPGRLHHHEDERFGFDLYAAVVRVRRPGAERPLFVERMAVEPRHGNLDAVGVMNGFDVMGTVYLIAPPETARRVLAATPSSLGPDAAWGTNLLPENCGLMFRALGRTTESVKALTRGFWETARLACTGKGLPGDFLWR